MSSHAEQSRLNNTQRNKLHNRIADIAPFLKLDGRFTVRDVDVDGDLTGTLKTLKQAGAIRQVGKVKKTKDREYRDWRDRDILNEWEWEERPKQHLQEYYDSLTLFPCGHRAHICNSREVDGFSCRECLDDGDCPEYSRELLEELGVV